MSHKGLPDFQHPLKGESYQIFYSFENTTNFLICPDRLEIVSKNHEHPDFLLEFVRGPSPLHSLKPYGVLDFRICPLYPMDNALQILRNRHPYAMLAPAIFSGGFLRFQLSEDTEKLPEELISAFPLAWNSLGITRVVIRLSEDAALFLKGCLKGDMLGLYTTAEIELFGISPRIPVKIIFDPRDLMNTIASLAKNKEELLISRSEIVNLFRKDISSLPLQVEGDFNSLDRNEFAEAIADRIRVKFGTFVPSPDQDFEPYLMLNSLDKVSSGSFKWDLSEPLKIPRPYILSLDPFETARQVVERYGIDSLVKKTVVPSLPTGVLPVSISINLPSNRIGIISIGVQIHAPPKPPHRPLAITESVEFRPPEDSSSVFLRLSPAEEQEYIYSTYLVMQDSGGIKQLNGPEIPHSGKKLLVGSEDFPVDFLPIKASQGLLNIARIKGVCRWRINDKEAELSFKIEPERPDVVLPLPKEAEDHTLEIEATSRDGSKAMKLGPYSTQALHLGLHSFPEYGPHSIEIECIFETESEIFAIDLLPEDSEEKTENITVLHFTPQKRKAEWTYLAESPFKAGYRFRPHSGPGEPLSDWSDFFPPFTPLVIHSGSNIGRTSMDTISEEEEYKGIHYYKNKDDPNTFFYIAGEPVPERDPQGRPTLSLFVSDQGAMLQLGTKWTVGAGLLENLREFIGEKNSLEPALVRLSQAAATIEKVTLALGDGQGGFEDLSTSTSSGFSPYTALFNLKLTDEQKARVMAALNGREKFLEIRYDITLPLPVTARITISGDMKEDLETLGGVESLEDSMARIKNGLSEGKLTIKRSATMGTPNDLMGRAEHIAHEKAAQLLQEMSSQLESGVEESTIEATSELTEMITQRTNRITDVSSWFPEGSGPDHVQILTTSVSEGESHPSSAERKKVRLGFENAEIPIAFIEVVCDEEKGILRSPSFEPVVLPVGESGKPLLIKTQYDIGGPLFESKLQSEKPGDWILQPLHLGLIKVVIDGSRPRDAGSKRARIMIHYIPSDKGTEDERTINFRHDNWSASWFVVVRSENLAGILEWEWKETTNDGSVIRHKTKTTDVPDLIL